MNNPYSNIDNAFIPFLNDTVQLSGKRKGNICYSTSIMCCMFENSSVDPFSEQIVDSDVVSIKITFPCKEWTEDIKPKIGDNIQTANNANYSISDVKINNGFYEISGRSK